MRLLLVLFFTVGLAHAQSSHTGGIVEGLDYCASSIARENAVVKSDIRILERMIDQGIVSNNLNHSERLLLNLRNAISDTGFVQISSACSELVHFTIVTAMSEHMDAIVAVSESLLEYKRTIDLVKNGMNYFEAALSSARAEEEIEYCP